jgi:hypothetical protein
LIWNSFLSSFAVVFPGAWDDTTEANWDRRFAINLESPCFQLTKTFLSQAFAAQVGRDQLRSGGPGLSRTVIKNVAQVGQTQRG